MRLLRKFEFCSLQAIAACAIATIVAGCSGGSSAPASAFPLSQDYVLNLTPSSSSIPAGVSNAGTGHSDATLSLNLVVRDLPIVSTADATITISNLPPQVSATPTSFTIHPNGLQTVSITVPTATPPGTYNILVRSDNGSFTHDAQFPLTITGSYALSLVTDRTALRIGAGASDTVFVTPTGANGYQGFEDISWSGSPADVNVGPYEEGAGTFTGNTTPYTFTAPPNAALSSETIVFDADTVNLGGQQGMPYGKNTVPLEIFNGPDFKLSWGTNSGEVMNYHLAPQVVPITLTSLNGFNAPVVVSFANLPPGLTLTPSTFSILPGSTMPVTFAVTSATPQISYTYYMQVDALSGSSHHRFPMLYENVP